MMNKNSGFTIAEMIVIAPAVILAIGAFIIAIIAMTGEALASRVSNQLAFEVESTLKQIESDVSRSSAFLATNSFALNSPQGENDSSADFSNADQSAGNALILLQSASTGNPVHPTGAVRLIGKPYTCDSPLINQNEKLSVNIVYFVKDNALYRRTLLPNNYGPDSCNLSWQQPSCTSNDDTENCKSQDELMIDGVSESGFYLQYYPTKQSGVANQFVSNSLASTEARSEIIKDMKAVGVFISAERKAAGRNVSWSASLRLSL